MKRVWLSITGSIIATFAAGPLLTISAQSGGTIEGHVKLTGTPPPNAVIKMGADPNCLKINAGKRVVQQTVVRAPDGGLMNAFVNVKGSFPQAAASPASAVIDQQGCVYHPRVQGARAGRTLEVRNSDATLHKITRCIRAPRRFGPVNGGSRRSSTGCSAKAGSESPNPADNASATD
jgi:hypothetical protein